MPGPYRSVLIKHLKEIADLRDKDPPTPYEEIAQFLWTEYQLKIRPSSIWAFVKARAEGKEPRKVAKISKKYLQPESTTAALDPKPPTQEVRAKTESPEIIQRMKSRSKDIQESKPEKPSTWESLNPEELSK